MATPDTKKGGTAAPSSSTPTTAAPTPPGTELATSGPKVVKTEVANADGEMVPEARGILVGTEEQQIAALYEALGVTDPSEIEVIVAGKLPFWPAIAGALLVGTIQGRREIPTRYKTPANPTGMVGMYTVTLTKPAVGGLVEQSKTKGGPPTLEYLDLDAGNQITVLERSMLKELELRVGQRVGILCVGKVQGREFEYWDYRIVGAKRTSEQIQAASMQAMAAMQRRQLPQGTAS